MHTLCTCLCNKVGHHGICQERADPACVLEYPELQLYTPGAVCRACYEAVRRLVGSAVRVRKYKSAEANRPVAGTRHAMSSPSQRGRAR